MLIPISLSTGWQPARVWLWLLAVKSNYSQTQWCADGLTLGRSSNREGTVSTASCPQILLGRALYPEPLRFLTLPPLPAILTLTPAIFRLLLQWPQEATFASLHLSIAMGRLSSVPAPLPAYQFLSNYGERADLAYPLRHWYPTISRGHLYHVQLKTPATKAETTSCEL